MHLPLRVRVDLITKIESYALDCRLLFMGERIREVLRTYREIVYRFQTYRDPARLLAKLQASDEIKQFYEIRQSEDITSVSLRSDIFSQPGPLEDLDLDLKFQLDNADFVVPLPLNKLQALGQLLPLLRADLNREDIEHTLRSGLSKEESDWAIDLISMLTGKGYLQDGKMPQNHFAKTDSFPRVTFLGHSSLLFQSRRATIVTDPCFRLEYRLPEYAMDVPRFKVDAVCISHSHWDHCDLQSLLWFDKNTEMIIPRVERPTVFNPPIVQAMRLCGFKNFREVNLWEPFKINDVEIVPVPFHGEQDEPDVEIDHYTYVLKTEGLSVYAGVDSYRDTFGDMKPVLERVKDEYHPDLAFLPVSKMCYEYKFGGVNGFCRYFDSTMLDRSFQYTASPEDAAEWVQALRPRWASPYATFNFSPWATPHEVAQFATALRGRALAPHLFPLRPFDFLEARDFHNGSSKELRRRSLVTWFRIGSAVRGYDRRWKSRNRIYRYLRSL